MTAIIIGATGLTGFHLVRELINSNQFNQIIVVVRSRSKLESMMSLQKMSLSDVSIIEFDFSNWDLLKSKMTAILTEQRIAPIAAPPEIIGFCALGTTIKTAGSKDAFYKVDVETVVQFAKFLKSMGASKFLAVSSQGASVKSASFYLKCKGEMETRSSQEFAGPCVFLRPGLLLGERTESRFLEQLAVKVTQAVPWIFSGSALRYKPIPAAQVARAMVQQAILQNQNSKILFIENESLHLAAAT